ncbi:MAG: response regulator transcription factor [Chloroflexi bacterium]|nr:response regulator transcription factor [Chloroflexota bacterium]
MHDTTRVLIIEDEPSLVETLQYNLVREGYEVAAATDGYGGVATATNWQPDLVLLDVMLPGIDGLEVCRRIRRVSNVPILMLTARAEEIDKVVGLELGADDYLAKPFGMRELLARIRALLRRTRPSEEVSPGAPTVEPAAVGRHVSGNLIIDTVRHEALLDGVPLELKPREYDLLLYLVEHRGMVVSRESILEQVWGWSYGGGSRTVDVHVRWLREKIEADPSTPERIQTVRGVGYRFEG